MSYPWRQFRSDEFWKRIPLWNDVDYDTFVDHKWQEKNVITNHRTLLHTISDLVYDATTAQSTQYINARYGVLLFKSNNNQAYDYDLTIVDDDEAVNALGIDVKEQKSKTTEIDWNGVLDKLGGFKAGAKIYFRQPTGYEMVGTYAVNPSNSKVLLITF